MDDDRQGRGAITVAGGAAFATGLGILAPGFKDLFLSLLNAVLNTDLYELPAPLGWVLLLLGILLLLLGYLGPSRMFSLIGGPSGKPADDLLVLRHIGFRPPVRTPTAQEAALNGSARRVIDFPIDLGVKLQGGDLDGALADHEVRMTDLEAVRAAQPEAGLAYAGIVQAPFQILAGYRLSTWVAASLMEWNRVDHGWTALAPGGGPDLGVTTTEEAVGAGGDVGVAVQISFPVAAAAVVASVPAVGRLIRIGLPVPRLDAVTHVGQANYIAAECRRVLDALASEGCAGRVHLFIAGPMSVGFRVGQLISRTLHPLIHVYAYSLNSQPPYPWGLVINPPAGGPTVVRA
jgi:hypothetical protein